ncbi:MAG TPA: hypothetical protein VMK30_00300 [Pleomorphomonadaceae bacterium]|nr:hypothetical protein [Pleomorphomonadaceae bacterium]
MRRARRSAVTLTFIGLALALSACAGQQPSRTVELATLSDSGVTGSAVLTDVGDGTTRVEVDVDPAGHPDMPAHIHPGTCVNLVPQPRYPLTDVVDGVSETVVPAALEDLFAGELALNLHASTDDYGTYTACAELN